MKSKSPYRRMFYRFKTPHGIVYTFLSLIYEHDMPCEKLNAIKEARIIVRKVGLTSKELTKSMELICEIPE